MVITGLTRNQLGSNPPRVRISPSPPTYKKDPFKLGPFYINKYCPHTIKYTLIKNIHKAELPQIANISQFGVVFNLIKSFICS